MKFRAQRYPTRYRVLVRIGPRSDMCTLFSISASGASIETRATLQAGDKIVIEYPGGRAAAVVKWVRSGRMGCAFDRALPQRDVDRIRFGVNASATYAATHRPSLTELR